MAAFPKKAKHCANKNQMLVDGLRAKARRKRTLEAIERRGVDLLHVELAELRIDPLPDMLVSIPGAVLHARRRHVLRVPVAEEKLARA